MHPTPLYYADASQIAYQLRYSWTGWPSAESWEVTPGHLIESTRSQWERDGLRVLEFRWTSKQVQILFSSTPTISPVQVVARAKGRLDHALRSAGIATSFSRKTALRSIGDNTRRDVAHYLERQVVRRRFAEPRFAASLSELTYCNPKADLSQPASSARGRYWYNLHLVLVVECHAPINDLAVLRSIRDDSLRIAQKKGYEVARLSVLPDHLHLAVRGVITQSPLEIGLAFQNNLAYLLGQKPVWSHGFYVGTFSEYTTHAVRRIARGDTLAADLPSHPHEADGEDQYSHLFDA